MAGVLAQNRKEIKDPEMRAVYADSIERMIVEGKNIVALDADLMRAIGTYPLWGKYPEQVIECGIAEANMVGVAAGLSSEGFVPFVHTFGCFAARRALDQIFMSCAYARQNVKILGSDPGVVAALNGGTHTPNEDIAALRAIPEITIVDICDAVMAAKLLPQIADTYGTFFIRYPRASIPRVYDESAEFTLGQSVQLREGKDLTIIASGIEVSEALDAAEALAQEGIEARVVDMFTIKPLDVGAVAAAARDTGAIVTAENHSRNGGLGSAVAEYLAEHSPVPMERVANQDRFGDVGSLRYLMDEYGLSAGFIVEKAKKVLSRK
ncbi:MAG: transketolase family protein [Lawsonibacter sp.]|nr:transketolase family protein [Lawsonibacter sp.]